MQKYFLFIFISFFVVSACTKNIETDNIETPDYLPEFALPLINLEVAVDEILEDADPDSYTVNTDGSVSYNNVDLTIARTDTFEVDLSDIGNSIKTMEYKLVIENGIPVNGNIQLFFINDKGAISDSLLDTNDQLILPANIDNSGNITSPSYQEVIIPFDESEIQEILDTEKMLINSYFQTESNGVVFTNQKLSIRLGAKVIFNL